MPTMTAAKSLRYANRSMKAGDTFEAPDKDARILVAMRSATYGTRDMRAQRPAAETQPQPPQQPQPAPTPVSAAEQPPQAPEGVAAHVETAAAQLGAGDTESDIEKLRADYERAAGKPANRTWGAKRLRDETAAAAKAKA